MTDLVLSLFSGADLLGRGFRNKGFCVVSAGDLITGQDVREFRGLPGAFEGIVGGPPCQDFSRARRAAPTGEGEALLGEFVRVVEEARPTWFLMENVPGCPDIEPEGYTVQRFTLSAVECGVRQRRWRKFQFGSTDGTRLAFSPPGRPDGEIERAVLATEGSKATSRRQLSRILDLMGLPDDFDLPGWSTAARFRMLGNGVPVPMAETLAQAIRDRHWHLGNTCACGCPREVSGRKLYFDASCRKRALRRRSGESE